VEATVAIDTLFRLDGRVALLTGAGGSFGGAIARGFAAAGARLFLNDISPERLAAAVRAAEAAGATCAACAGDTGSASDIEAIFAALDKAYGQIDVLVNIAGIGDKGQPETYPLETWEHIMRVNLTGSFLMSQAAGRRMIARGQGGSIINFSSIAGSSSLGRGSVAYGASKSGVDQLTRELAVEWAHHRIRVNAIKPVQFLNEGWRKQAADPANAKLVKRVLAGIPMGRMGEPEEIVGPALFLASDAASMVTGVLLPVDGGNLALNPTGSLPTHE
jgi:NAD(P)-dependent dehydrogenase (short-subunit alcohol dehydrogenase family)